MMQTTLCFDFGNTRLKCAVFTNGELTDVLVLKDDSNDTILELIGEYKPIRTLLSSVINHNQALDELLQQHSDFHRLNHLSRLPVKTPVGKPETIGADRLGLVVGAMHEFPENHCLVVGLGSCITFNFVNKRHEFLGGGISPGLEMRFRSMHEFTARLPLIKPDGNFPLIGYDTRTNMLSGVILGMSKEIDGIIDEYLAKYANLKVFLTGGDMHFFKPHLKSEIIFDPYLIYKGLYAISEENK
ncbi:type III pantothenate kinase [Danxiaibacter flavus]|uniref:Type III pantothenate kinase n=1 Tax=Danxiaibacter flavus TaxID=3049108 RepID=A0ABV3ZH81_9BACT|nr:type III pantothenate kinase [Chitinophagaceae bacterium DXS]